MTTIFSDMLQTFLSCVRVDNSRNAKRTNNLIIESVKAHM